VRGRRPGDDLIKLDLGCLGVILVCLVIGGIGAAIRALVRTPGGLETAGIVAGTIIACVVAAILVRANSPEIRKREQQEIEARKPAPIPPPTEARKPAPIAPPTEAPRADLPSEAPPEDPPPDSWIIVPG